MAGAAFEDAAGPAAWGAHLGEGWPCWEAEHILRHCPRDQCSAFGGIAQIHHGSSASEGSVQVQQYWPARLGLGIPPPALYVQWLDIQLKFSPPTQMRSCVCIYIHVKELRCKVNSLTVDDACTQQTHQQEQAYHKAARTLIIHRPCSHFKTHAYCQAGPAANLHTGRIYACLMLAIS